MFLIFRIVFMEVVFFLKCELIFLLIKYDMRLFYKIKINFNIVVVVLYMIIFFIKYCWLERFN